MNTMNLVIYTLGVITVTFWVTLATLGTVTTSRDTGVARVELHKPEAVKALESAVGLAEPRALKDVCETRRAARKAGTLDMKKVAYFERTIVVEKYIRNSFEEHGYKTIPFEDRLDATFIIGKGPGYHFNWEMCSDTMKHNHIYGQSAFVHKDTLTHTLREGDKEGVGKAIGMWGRDFYKTAFVGEHKPDCDELMEWVEEQKFAGGELDRAHMISKQLIGGHNGKGLNILDGRELNAMLSAYKRTQRCERNTLFQHLLHNPLTIKGHTFSMRLFFTVLRVKPALVAFARGYVRITQSKFDKNSTDEKVRISNADKVWSKSDDGLPHFWSLAQLNSHLYESGQVSDPQYVTNTLIPKFCAVFTNIFKASQAKMKGTHSYFGLFGADMTLDENLNPWLFEVNFSPELSRFVPLNVIKDMYYDLITIQERLLEKHTAPWKTLKDGLRNPKRFTVLVDEQQDYVFKLN